MCGVFAVCLKTQIREYELRRCVDLGLSRIKHRGPDGEGIWLDSNNRVGFGHVRLSIVDLETGSQPLVLDDGTVIIFNGEIYNYQELRNLIGSEQFKTNSDTEVVAQAFRLWGEDCTKHLRGMFAFLIWDPKSQSIFFCRDRFGIKPLYYYINTEGTVYFASEIKALIPFVESRKVSNRSLRNYFAFQFTLGDQTLLEGVKQVMPAQSGWLKNEGEIKVKYYWEVQYNLDYNHSEKYFIDQLKALIDDSTKHHMISDVEVGAYLSGGLDSSILAILCSTYNNKLPFKVFNGRFMEGNSFDESRFARSVADDNQMNLYIASITERDFVDCIEDVIYHLDTPVAGPGAFSQFIVSKLASKHLKVIIGGQGGDEIFGGYARYLIAYFEQCIKGAIEGTLDSGNFIVNYESIIPNLNTLIGYKPLIKDFFSDGLFDSIDSRYFRLINKSNKLGEIVDDDYICHEQNFYDFKSMFWGANVGHESYFDLMTHFDFKTFLPALLQVEDRMSMAHGIESRVPFLDHPLVEFIATVPANIKFLNGELKRMLKTCYYDILPSAIFERRDKMGFPVPLNLWINRGGIVRDFIGDKLGTERAKSRPYLKNGLPIDSLFNSETTYGRNVWALLSLELWHNQFVD